MRTVDSYSESNYSTSMNLGGYASGFNYSTTYNIGQSFTVKTGLYVLSSCKFYIKRIGTVTGNIRADLFLHQGEYGISSVRGSLVASSDIKDASTLPTDFELVEFNFTGANKVPLNNGYYVMAMVDLTLGNSEYVAVGLDDSTPTHSGNAYRYVVSNIGIFTTPFPELDLIFYVYGDFKSPIPPHFNA